MKMSKASEDDLNMAMDLSNALDLLGQRFLPCMPEAIEQLGPDDESERFDRLDDTQCGRALRHLLDIVERGSLFRVVWGMAVLLDPRNQVVHPDLDYLDKHPGPRLELEGHQRALVLLCGLHPCMTIDGPAEAVAERIFDAVSTERRELLDRIKSLEANLEFMRANRPGN